MNMKKVKGSMFTRIFSFVMILAMVITMVPSIPVVAAEEDPLGSEGNPYLVSKFISGEYIGMIIEKDAYVKYDVNNNVYFYYSDEGDPAYAVFRESADGRNGMTMVGYTKDDPITRIPVSIEVIEDPGQDGLSEIVIEILKAKSEIRKAAGDNPSEAMIKIVKEIIEDIDSVDKNGENAKADVAEKKNAGIQKINAQKELESGLKAEKDAAKKEIKDAAGENPTDEVKGIVRAAEDAIEAAKDSAGVDAAKNKAKNDIDKQLARENAAKELSEAKEDAKKDIKDAAGENPSESMNKIVETAQKNIDAAETKEEVNKAKEDGIKAVKEQLVAEGKDPLTVDKNSAKKEVEEAAGDKPSESVNAIVKDAKDKIDAAETEAEVEKAKNEGIVAIKAQIEKEAGKNPDGDDPLSVSKNAANKELEELAGKNPSDAVKDIVKEAKEKIDAAKEQKDLDKALQDAKDKINAQLEKEKLETAKQEAKAEIDKIAGNSKLDQVKDAVKEAKKEIDAADTEDAVKKVVEKYVVVIKSYIDGAKYLTYSPSVNNILVVGDRIAVETYYPGLKVKKWKYECLSGDKPAVKKAGKYFSAKAVGKVRITPCDKKGNPIGQPVEFKAIKPVVEKKIVCTVPGQTINIMDYVKDNDMYFPTAFECKNQKSATVSSNIVTVVNKSGIAMVKVKYGRKTYNFKVQVKIPKIKATAKVSVGKTIKLTAVNYVDGVTFESTNPAVATVTNDGKKLQITGVKADTCEIIVKNKGIECGRCVVTVK